MPEPADLYRSGFAGEHQQAVVAGVHRQIDQNVDAVFAHAMGEGPIAHARHVVPQVAVAAQTCRDAVRLSATGIHVDREASAIVLFEKGKQEPRDGVIVQVGGDVRDAQAPVGRAVVAVRSDLRRKRVGVPARPGAGLLEDGLRVETRRIRREQDHVAVCDGVARVERDRLAVSLQRLFHASNRDAGVSQLKVSKRAGGVDGDRSLAAGHSFFDPLRFDQRRAQAGVGQGRARIEPDGPLGRRHRAVESTKRYESEPELDQRIDVAWIERERAMVVGNTSVEGARVAERARQRVLKTKLVGSRVGSELVKRDGRGHLSSPIERKSLLVGRPPGIALRPLAVAARGAVVRSLRRTREGNDRVVAAEPGQRGREGVEGVCRAIAEQPGARESSHSRGVIAPLRVSEG